MRTELLLRVLSFPVHRTLFAGCMFPLSRRYYAANTVSLPREVEQIWGCGGPLNGVCALHHYCTVTRLNPESYRYAARIGTRAVRSFGPLISLFRRRRVREHVQPGESTLLRDSWIAPI